MLWLNISTGVSLFGLPDASFGHAYISNSSTVQVGCFASSRSRSTSTRAPRHALAPARKPGSLAGGAWKSRGPGFDSLRSPRLVVALRVQ